MPFNKVSIALLVSTFIAYLLIIELGLIPMNMFTNLLIRLVYYAWIMLYVLYKLNPKRLFSVPIVVFALFFLYTVGGLIIGIDMLMWAVYTLLSLIWFVITLFMAITFRRLHLQRRLSKYKNKDRPSV